ncbi:MAG: thiamine pyrophosphate-binding protein, partial [Myxococcota bacterium]
MIRVADYIADFIYNQGVKRIFMLSGGGMMFLSDGVAKHPHLKYVCNHHEQAAAMGGVGYAKYREDISCVYVTTGCGGTNAITGLLDAWQDSTPVIFISGQSKRKETIRNSGLKLRQFGVQEADIISIVKPITKYAVMVNDPRQVRYHLEKAVHLSKSGRPGPVWIDVPMDVQAAMVDETALGGYRGKAGSTKKNISCAAGELNAILSKSRRPVIIAGQGVRLSHCVKEFREFIERYRIPVVASRLGIDVLPSGHPLFIGRIGNKGDRAGNFAVQNADTVIVMGSRLSVSSTGHEYSLFAREAKIVVIDIDPVEHAKKTVRIDLFIKADLKEFLLAKGGYPVETDSAWLEKCRVYKEKYPVCLPEYRNNANGVNLYYFVNRLAELMPAGTPVVSDAGSSVYVVSQAFMFKEGQRHVTSGGQADMGYGLPAGIGVSVARDMGEVVVVTGDGSFQLNIQELQTLKHYGLPVKVFVWNNDGYLSIRATQKKFFSGRYIGTDSTSGLSFPDLEKIAGAYGLSYHKISNSAGVEDGIRKVLAQKGPVVCEVVCDRDQEIKPTVSAFTRP